MFFPLFVPISVSLRTWYGFMLGIYFLPGWLFSVFLFYCRGCIIFLYLFCFFLFFCFSILRVVPLPLILRVCGPSPRSLRRCGLACTSATLIDYSYLLRIFYLLVLYLFQQFLSCMLPHSTHSASAALALSSVWLAGPTIALKVQGACPHFKCNFT